MNRLVLTSLTAAALALVARTAAADCTINTPATVVNYVDGTLPATVDLCDTVGATRVCRLSGWLYQPSGASAGNSPAVVYVTDNDPTESRHDACEIVNYFIARGYVVFTPFERGVTDDSATSSIAPGNGFHSTGTFIGAYITAHTSASETATQAETAYLKTEAGDLSAAVSWLRAQTISGKPLVAPGKVAILGHGYGGALGVLVGASSLSPPPAAVVDLSGGSIEWNNGPEWATLVDNAVVAHHAPVMMQDVANLSQGGTYPAMLTPFLAADTAPDIKMALYAGFGVSSDAQAVCTARSYSGLKCASYAFVTDAAQVARWLDTAHDFIVEYGAM